MRAIAAALLVVGCVAAVQGQTPPAAGRKFDAASIKANRSGGRTSVEMGGGRFVATNVTLRELLGLAYPIEGRLRNDDQVAGGPAWVYSDRFDVIATGAPQSLGAPAPGAVAPPESAALNDLRAMVRSLLADRFQVIVHDESRELASYTLVRLRAESLGPQLRPSNADCAAERAAAGGRAPAADAAACGGFRLAGPGRLTAHAVTMPMLAALVSALPVVRRAVADRTALTGTFDLELTWNPELTAAAGDAAGALPDRASIFMAVQEQLGLRLDAAKRMADVLVIDRADPPSAD